LIIINHTTKYRNRAEIYASLLRGAVSGETEGVTITRLMYASILSYRQMNIHLQVLLKDRLLEYPEQEKVYKITIRGRQFLELYSKMDEMLEAIR
jgi:predicted transcriptional regulator